MEIRLLRYFLTIAEEGTISRAAAVLHITQPTLSRQLKNLEIQLGSPLFTRDARQMELTEAGLFLKSRATEILMLSDATEKEFIDRKQQLFSGNIAIGCVEADNSDTLALMLEEFIADYPQVTFSMFDGTSEDIRDRLDKGLLDVAILLEPIETNRYVKLVLPRVEYWGLAVAATSPLAQRDWIAPQDLPNLPLVVGGRTEVKDLLTAWYGHAIDELSIVGTMNLGFNTMPLVIDGKIVTLSIEGAITAYHSSDVKFVPFKPELNTNCVLTWKQGRQMSPVVTEFIRRFRESFG